MSNFTFIKSLGKDQLFEYFAIKSELIEDLEIAECYDHNGQQIGDECAGNTEEYTATGTGFTYYDGNNFQSVILTADVDDWCTHVIETDESVIASLNNAIETKELVSEKRGVKVFESRDWGISYTLFPTFWYYAFESK